MDVGTSDVLIEFPAALQSLEALRAAAYRLVGSATCQIDKTEDRWVCKLTRVSGSKKDAPDAATLKTHFLDLVTDENLRHQIAQRTDGVRNVILSLAFGSLAGSSND
jgi:His-Xaa-Ser system protein HxsD